MSEVSFERLWVWDVEEVRERLRWYYMVATNQRPAKYLICRRVPAELSEGMTYEELWSAHRKASAEFHRVFAEIREGTLRLRDLEEVSPSLMDLKVEIVRRMLRSCVFCRWRCRVDRTSGSKLGTCMLARTSKVSSYFHHLGEELPIRGTLGSGTIFFTSCNMRCGFCLHPDVHVMTDLGPRRIEELFEESGDEVVHGDGSVRFPRGLYTYTYNGERVRVSKVFKHHYSGELLVIEPLYAPPLAVTPGHEVVVWSDLEGGIRKKRAKDLAPGDRLLVPKVRREVAEEVFIDVGTFLGAESRASAPSSCLEEEAPGLFIGPSQPASASVGMDDVAGITLAYAGSPLPMTGTVTWVNGELDRQVVAGRGPVTPTTEVGPGIPPMLRLDEELAELLGFYCAVGLVRGSAGTPGGRVLVFSFSRSKEGLAVRTSRLLERRFGVRPRLTRKGTSVSVEVDDASLALLFAALCGSSPHDKRVPEHLFRAPDGVVRSFLEALVRGAGVLEGRLVSIDTSSRDLAHGVYALYLILGHLPSYSVQRPSQDEFTEPRGPISSEVHRVTVTLQGTEEGGGNFGCGAGNGWVAVPILSVRRVWYDGPVYNLEVDHESHAFTASFLAVGNCQNGDISKDKDNGLDVTPELLAKMMWELRAEGCHNVNLVGGEPTVHLHTIVEAISLLGKVRPTPRDLQYMWLMKPDYLRWRRLPEERYTIDGQFNVPILWNSNMFMSGETLEVLREVVDIWLPDFKFGNNKCAIRLSRTPWYWETVTENHRRIYEWGEDIVVRHLVMPNHVECCTKPVLRWIAENMPGTLVNVMDQYHPDCFADPRSPEFDPRLSDIARYPTREEIEEAYRFAEELGIPYEVISLEKKGFFLGF